MIDTKRTATLVATALLAMLAAACGGGGGGGGGSTTSGGGTPVALPGTGCASPMPAQVIDSTITDDIPSDTDPTANPQPTSTVAFSILLPARCPGDRFPLVLHSHGYGGNRIRTLAADGTLHPDHAFFPSITELVQALPFHGYGVISVDERGHGDSTNANARIIDPAAEVQDMRRILDWAWDNADTYGFLKETTTGVAKDLRVGSIGLSYGGGYQMPLAALDPRIDAMVPNGTWNDLLYSLLPGDAVKLSFDGLLCLLARTANTSATPNTGVHNTPLVASLCNTVGVTNAFAFKNRSRSALQAGLALPTTLPRPVQPEEISPFFFTHSARYFELQQASHQSWGFGESRAQLRAVPALFLQGNRDVLFNLTEAYWNANYFGAAGGDVRLLSNEGGHMNPLANQVEGTANCGTVDGTASILSWFDKNLRGVASASFDAIPRVCISVADTVAGQPGGTPAGLKLASFPVGSLSGTGAVPARADAITATVAELATAPSFVPVITIAGSGRVLAGAPRIASLTVTRGPLSTEHGIAFVGVGIVRGGQTILVDDQVTPFDEGTHTFNAGVSNSAVLLPAVGEMLQDGDQVGLLFYPQHVQYAAILSAASVPGATNVVNMVLGTSIPPVLSSLDLSSATVPNPYSVSASGVELPILVPGSYPGSTLVQ